MPLFNDIHWAYYPQKTYLSENGQKIIFERRSIRKETAIEIYGLKDYFPYALLA